MMSQEALLQETKTQVRCILVSSPLNTTIQKLNQDYLNLIGEPVPYARLGYKTLFEFLKDSPDVVQINGRHPSLATVTPVITENLEGLNSLIMNQKLSKSKYGHARGRRQTLMAPTPRQRLNPSTWRNKSVMGNAQSAPRPIVRRFAPRPVVKNSAVAGSFSTSRTHSSGTLMSTSSSNNNPAKFLERTTIGGKELLSKNVPKSTILNRNPVNNNNTPASFFGKSKSLVDDRSTIENNNLQIDQETKAEETKAEETKAEVVTAEVVTAEEEKSPDISTHENSDASSKSEHETSGNENDTVDKQSESSSDVECERPYSIQPDLSHLINNKLRRILKELIKSFPNGMRLVNLAYHYEQYCGKRLVYERLGFVSALQLCLQLPDTFRLERLDQSGDFILFDATAETPPYALNDWKRADKAQREVPKPQLKEESYSEIDIGLSEDEVPGMMNYSDEIDTLWKTNKFVAGKEFKIVITEVYDPTKFWFAIYDEDHFDKMNTMMDDLCTFYAETEGEHRIPKNRVHSKMYTAVYFAGSWQRIFIINRVGTHKVKAYFIDYGTVAIVDISCMRYLPKIYQSFPKQALRGRLDYIIPKDKENTWPTSITREFVRRIRDKVFTAYVSEVDEKDNIVWMVVREDDDAKGITLNEELVRKGQAEICSDDDCIIRPKNGERRKYLDYLWPLFHQLEDGKALSFKDLMRIRRKRLQKRVLSVQLNKLKNMEHARTQIEFNDDNENKCGHFAKRISFREAETDEEFAWLEELSKEYVHKEEEVPPTAKVSVEHEESLEDVVRMYRVGEHKLNCIVFNYVVYVMTEEFLKKYIPFQSVDDMKKKLINKGMCCAHALLRLQDDEVLFRALQGTNSPVRIEDESVVHLTALRSLDVILYAFGLDTQLVSNDIKNIFEKGLHLDYLCKE